MGVEGLALLRHLYDGTDEDADRRLSEVRAILDDDGYAAGELTTEADVRSGYGAWARRYDEPGNQIIAIEEPIVWSLLDRRPAGRALDAACGTGRHARHLVARGHRVVGSDSSREMLRVGAEKVPGATFMEADVRRLPAPDFAFDLAVCGLALAHVADLGAAVCELARVLAPGGRLVVSVLHPFQAHLGWQAPFEDQRGARRFIREHPHTHADYLTAFRQAGLRVEECVEPRLGPDDVRAKRRAFGHIPDATMAAYLELPAVLVWEAEKSG